MRQTANNKTMKRQSSFFFCNETNKNNQNVILDNIVYFDKNHTKGQSSKQIEKREKIINKLLEHEKSLKW